ncbi:MAG: arsenate reductase (glutaredoxin) [Gammaproteobacteria bacterium]|nr:MAG: arsenate reductase (glutaredoxin) [Gammaproteobacteria bacterium]
MEILIYHNPRCSKSRQTLELLESKGYAPTVIEYLKTPPTHEELGQILDLLSISPRELVRKKEPEYKNNNLDDPDLSDDQLIEAMTKHPILIERPIVINNDRAAIGRPPENVLKLL